MATKKQTISVRLVDSAKQRVERAAGLLKQSSSAFLGKAGEERAHQILLEWAVGRYGRGEASFSQLAGETGLAVEEIMEIIGTRGEKEALQTLSPDLLAAALAQLGAASKKEEET